MYYSIPERACLFLAYFLSNLMSNFNVLFILFFLFPLGYTIEDCPKITCGKNKTTIRFPFRLEGQQSENCGYPGFEVSCSTQNITALKLPSSQEFFVRDINYLTQVIRLYDPRDCLPKRLLEFNITGSPFSVPYYHNYTFLSCPVELTRNRFTSIDCLSNSTTSVLATSSSSLAKSMSDSCEIITTLPVPVRWPVQYDDGFSSDLGGELRLKWNDPECGWCEGQGGICRFKSKTSKEIGCFPNTDAGGSSDGLRIFKIVSLTLAIPPILCAAAIVIFVCMVDKRRRGVGPNEVLPVSGSAAVSPQPNVEMTGLDESTIESYTKVVLGESRRVPGPSDGSCPICLSDYQSKETVRCIPECEHCFHAGCIDEWLRMKGTCPLCRNSPSPPRVIVET